jgi:exodeoxyribonuclease VII large subunit
MSENVPEKIYTVSELNRRARQVLEGGMGEVQIEGEISRLTRHSSGHWYFTLKDAGAAVSAAMFRRDNQQCRVTPRDGQQVRVRGRVTLYEPRGSYQVVVSQLEEAGRGSLQEQFEKLKAQLQAEGLFEPARKKPLPLLPGCVGVVTSRTGAAVRDILHVLQRRCSGVRVVLAPVHVQGRGAAESIARAIAFLNRGEPVRPDVLIVGRGGGSLEDLWAFNEAPVARAIAASEIPVISAVGHEIDYTLADFAADVRAPTPSAAAELAVPETAALQERVQQSGRRLSRRLREQVLELRTRWTAAARSYVFTEPQRLVLRHRERVQRLELQMRHALREQTRYRERIDGLRVRLGHSAQQTLFRRQQRLDELQQRLRRACAEQTGCAAETLQRLQVQLRALSPLAVLERGYSVTRTPEGKVVRSAEALQSGDALLTRLAEGEVRSRVE